MLIRPQLSFSPEATLSRSQSLVDAAARDYGIRAAGLAWAEPFTDSGYLLARSMARDGMWIADYS